jgi:hypothetical protein
MFAPVLVQTGEFSAAQKSYEKQSPPEERTSQEKVSDLRQSRRLE